MSTPFYDLASLVVVPSGYKASKVYAQKPLTTDGQLTFSRASTATRVNASGLIEEVASNVPRLDYLNSSCPRLLLEPQRTNFIFPSEDFSAANFQKLASGTGVVPVVTTNQGVAPTGYANADRIDFNIGAGTTASDVSRVLFSTTTAPVAGSVYLKSLDGVSTYNMFLRVANTTTSIVVTGEWQRFSAVELVSGSNLQVGLQGNLATSASASILAWGAQLEQGSYATSYVPSLGAAVTRGADAASKTGISSLIGQTEGTIYTEVSIPTGADSSRTAAIQGGSNRIAIGVTGTTVGFVIVTSAGIIYNSAVAYTWQANNKIALAYKDGSSTLYVNGVSVLSTTASFTLGGDIANLYLGQLEFNPGAGQNGQRQAQALLFKTRLSNAQLAELTSL